MFHIQWFFVYTICSSNTLISSLFRSPEFYANNKDWIVEHVQVIPLDDGQLEQHLQSLSFLIHRTNFTNNSTSFILDLTPNQYFNSQIPIEYDQEEIPRINTNCSFYTGSIRHWGVSNSIVAISICSGVLSGLIHHKEQNIEYILEPITEHDTKSHILIYRVTSTLNTNQIWSCEVESFINHTETHRAGRQHRTRRSIIRERFIETLLVADASVTESFAHPHVTELYLLTMMNMVNSIYRHASLGYPVEIVLTRIILLNNQSDYRMASHSQETLTSFCSWQEDLKKTNKKNRTIHHDVGVFLTKKSLCRDNTSCSTIGLAHMAGICVVNRSCNINQDIGLISAYTIAHEIGHNLGMHHDGDKGYCPGGDTIMVPSYSRVPVNMWSQCSRDNLTDFFDQGWGKCLNNRPTIIPPHEDLLPGVIFDLDEQCRLAIGAHSTSCFPNDEPPIDICTQMMCTKIHEGRSVCVSTLTNQPADGTLCGINKWCVQGRCTPMNYREEMLPVHGGWSPWTPWSSCSHSCGLGVEYQFRTCTNPKPEFGGKQCLGVRKRYRTCNIASCKKASVNQTHEIDLNCEELNNKSNGTMWKTVSWFTPVPCMVFCTPVLPLITSDNDTSINGSFTLNGDEVGKIESIKFRDGTQCTIEDENDEHPLPLRGMCITGQCQKLGCDNQLYSTAVEDECGICNGNRSLCQKINKIIQYKRQDSVSAGSYVKIGTIGKGIATFQIKKKTQSSSFLAIKIKDRYHLNGGRSITETSLFYIGQTRFWYKRGTKHEIIEGRGYPLNEDVDIMLLNLNDDTIQIDYLYWELVNKSKSIPYQTHLYKWKWDNDTDHDCSCQNRQLHCTFQTDSNETIVVTDRLCDPKTKPSSMKCHSNKCSNQSPFTPRWYTGSWRACEGRCWPDEAFQRRSLLCVRTLTDNRTHTVPTSLCLNWFSSIPITIRECPESQSISIPKCSTLKSYSLWNTSQWVGNCSSENPCAMRYRTVTCVSHDINAICTADENLKPIDRQPCNKLCGEWKVSHWSNNCTGTCSNSSLTRRVWCSSSICDLDRKPVSSRSCFLPECANASIYTTKKLLSIQTTKISTKATVVHPTARKFTVDKKKIATQRTKTTRTTIAMKKIIKTTVDNGRKLTTLPQSTRPK